MASQLFSAAIDSGDTQLDPIHVTFTGGAKDPFCRWFPYLEGYSPEFVRAVLNQFTTHARTVLDPFGGTATTAFTAAEAGLAAYICEVNPVMQFIFEAKTAVRELPASVRLDLAGAVRELAERLSALLETCAKDKDLEDAYHEAFSGSVFFTETTLEQVLRGRALVDKLSESEPRVATLLTIAMLAALIPVSLLKRAGDVRFMTAREVAKGIADFDRTVQDNLTAIAEDLATYNRQLQTRPVLLCSDARDLPRLPSIDVDTVITSPPYINGTNYFRNTRLELWFLRCLRTPSDLRKYRQRAITAGINDVTIAKSAAPHTASVERLVRRLERNAYDPRIPLMISSYFAEMTQVFRGISAHLRPGAITAVDIGDSNYNGVHVAADAILSECLRDIGFSQLHDIELRQRRSKNGAPLRQALLVFQWQRRTGRRTMTPPKPAWRDRWERFVAEMPHQAAPYSARNWGSALHSLCSYPGKLKPAIAHHLVETFVPKGGAMLDPFVGVGTIPFEAASAGRQAFGIDLSAAAYTVAAAKLSIREATETATILSEIEAYVSTYRPTSEELAETTSFGLNGKIADFYNKETLREVLALRRYFQLQTVECPSLLLVRAAALHLLHGNRPYAFSRRSHPLTPYAPTGESDYRPVMPRLREKTRRALEEPLPSEFITGRAYHQDSTTWWPSEVDSLDAVITSPPFFDSTRFHVQNWLRLWFMGWSPESFKAKPKLFVDERQKTGFDVYEHILRQSKERLKPGGALVFHLGKSRKCDMADEILTVAKRWFRRHELFDESVVHCESHGLRDKGTVTDHQYLVLY